jgi:hypothetical protein
MGKTAYEKMLELPVEYKRGYRNGFVDAANDFLEFADKIQSARPNDPEIYCDAIIEYIEQVLLEKYGIGMRKPDGTIDKEGWYKP